MTPTGKRWGRGWAYIGAVLGGAVSIAANVAHSYVPPADTPVDWHPHGGAVVGAVFWPVALFVAVEIFARINWPDGRRWTALRFLGLLPVAIVAAVVSYRHMSGLLNFYGEDGLTVGIGPLAVDGLMVMAAGALIATSPARTAVESVVAVPAAVPAAAPPASTAEAAPADNAPPSTQPVEPAAVGTQDLAQPKLTAAAKKIARVRQRQPSLTQQEIAQRAGVHINTVKNWWAHTAPTKSSPAPINGEVPNFERATS